ncbi:MAG: hypothetical protein R3E12_09440 [Candidatus Eisenbacteria bacterium]|uniref:Uncharacterized protein n=1 Tax=Eiseniibacteriota bacterium TaxID=2212470 RepID=A0A956M0M2_UNCEI|nr:hypothetical protein [Candidatus Eisenbacteria bacterium]
MDKHAKLAAIIQIAFGIPGILIGALVYFIVSGGGLISGDPTAIAITGMVGWTVGGLLVLTHLPGVIAGAFALRGHAWARYVLLAVAVLELLDIPFGTLAGAYTLWALMRDPRETPASGAPQPHGA